MKGEWNIFFHLYFQFTKPAFHQHLQCKVTIVPLHICFLFLPMHSCIIKGKMHRHICLHTKFYICLSASASLRHRNSSLSHSPNFFPSIWTMLLSFCPNLTALDPFPFNNYLLWCPFNKSTQHTRILSFSKKQ